MTSVGKELCGGGAGWCVYKEAWSNISCGGGGLGPLMCYVPCFGAWLLGCGIWDRLWCSSWCLLTCRSWSFISYIAVNDYFNLVISFHLFQLFLIHRTTNLIANFMAKFVVSTCCFVWIEECPTTFGVYYLWCKHCYYWLINITCFLKKSYSKKNINRFFIY